MSQLLAMGRLLSETRNVSLGQNRYKIWSCDSGTLQKALNVAQLVKCGHVMGLVGFADHWKFKASA